MAIYKMQEIKYSENNIHGGNDSIINDSQENEELPMTAKNTSLSTKNKKMNKGKSLPPDTSSNTIFKIPISTIH
jgi:hypothetical protein